MSFDFNTNGMMGGMPGMGMMGGMSGMAGGMNAGGNVWQYYTSKYGCEDCFTRAPNCVVLHSNVHPINLDNTKPNWWQRLLSKMGC